MAGNNIDPKLFDRRVIERNVAKGLIKEADYKDYLKKLPDESANGQWVQMDMDDPEVTLDSELTIEAESEEES